MNGTLRGVASGLAGLASLVFSVGGCAPRHVKDSMGVVRKYDAFGYEFTPESEAKRQQMIRDNYISEEDGMALAGFGLMGAGVARNSPAGTAFGQRIFEQGLSERVAEAGKDNVQQNVIVNNSYESNGQNIRPNQTFCSIPYNQPFSCTEITDVDGNGKIDDCEIFDKLNGSLRRDQYITLGVKVIGSGKKIDFFIAENKTDNPLTLRDCLGYTDESKSFFYAKYPPGKIPTGKYRYTFLVNDIPLESNSFVVIE